MLAVSWSGGKDSCLAYWKSVSESNGISHLLNTYRKDSGRVAFHGTRAGLVRMQAEALGKPILQKTVDDGNGYAETFLEALLELKMKGVDGVIFGDIDVKQNREWSENVCRKAGLGSTFPLWGMDQKKIMGEFIGAGFKAVVVAVNSRFLAKSDLGSQIDRAWMRRIEGLRDQARGAPITYCGENGEYHTFVYGGPGFRNEIKFTLGETVERNGYWLVDIVASR